MSDRNDQNENRPEVDEWGDPIEKKRVPKDDETYVDEWGDPVKYIRVNEEQEKIEHLTEKQKLRLEKELVEAGLIFPRSHYLPRGRFRSILAVLLAFLFGLFIVLGAVLGTGVFLGSAPLNKALNFFGVDAGDYIGEEYLDKTLFDTAADLVKTIGKGKDLTVNDLRKYSPYLDKALGAVWERLGQYGVNVDTDVLYATPVGGMLDYVTGPFAASLELGKLIGVKETDSAVLAILYGERGTDYTFDEGGNLVVLNPDRALTVKTLLDMSKGEGDSLEELVFGIPLGSLMGLESVDEGTYEKNALMYTLCYGSRGVDWDVDENGLVVMKSERTPVTVDDLRTQSNKVISGLSLGSMLGLDVGVSDDDIQKNALMYTLCYGSRGVDWELEGGSVKLLSEKKPTTINDLTTNSNGLLNGLPLGEMMGLRAEEDYAGSEIIFSLCYGSKGADWNFVDGVVKMAEGHKPNTVGDLIDNSATIIDGMYIDELLTINADSDALMRYIAFGNEIEKDGEGRYLIDPDNIDPAQDIVTDPETQTRSYTGNAKYYIKDGTVVMLGDPNTGDPADPATWTPYPKNTVRDLKNSDDLVGGIKIGDVTDVGTSGLLHAISDWTISDLTKQEKIDSLKLGDVLGVSEGSSGIMRALSGKTLGELQKQETIDGLQLGDVFDVPMGEDDTKPEGTSGIVWALRGKTIGDLQKQETIDSLKLGDVLEIKEGDAGIMAAMKDWKISDLSNQNRIERLKLGQILTIGDESSKIMQAMKDWRISDLTKQEKIDSLTLGDVIEIKEGDAGILVALKDCTIGGLSTRMNTLSLNEILGAASIQDNKILSHLGNSTVETLAQDMSRLTIGEVFGDEIYSFMEIKDVKVPGAESGATTRMTYAKMYELYSLNHAKEDYNKDADDPTQTNPFVPHPLTKSGEGGDVPITQSDVTVKYMHGGEEVTLEYYDGATKYEGEVKTDAARASANRDPEKEKWQTPYYYEKTIALTPVYTYSIVDYDEKDTSKWTEITVSTTTDGKLTCTVDGQTYDVKEDAYGLYYEYTKTDETDERVDLDCRITDYVNGNKSVKDGQVLDKNDHPYTLADVIQTKTTKNDQTEISYSITEKVWLEEKYVTAGGAPCDKSDVQETYIYDGEPVDRYMRGIWFLLLGSVNKDTGVITFNAEKSVLEMDSLVTNVNSVLTDMALWQLYFHGLLPSNPYAQFISTIEFQHNNEAEPRRVNNLNEVAISEIASLVKHLGSMAHIIT